MKRFLFLPGLLLLYHQSPAANYDVVISGGRVVDGSGNPACFADIGVRGGRIEAIRPGLSGAKLEIDATGLIVAPGFIDVHTHADTIARQPLAENFLRMGVTTIVAGNCGSSTTDIGNLFRDVERTHVSINFATLIGHNDIRQKAMGGCFDRAPTPEEMQTMKLLVQRGMKDGAVGLSTGLIYLPGTFSKTDEIVELAKVAAADGGIYTSHMRHEDNRIFEALDEVFLVAREAHIRAEVSHVKLSGERAWGQADKVLSRIEKARDEGLDITQDLYAYTASSTTLRQLIPDSAFDSGSQKFLALLQVPEDKARLIGAMKEQLSRHGGHDFSYAVIASCSNNPALNGLNIAEAARKLRGSDSLDDQAETILEIEKNGGATGVFHGISEEDMQQFMRHPNTMFACDSGLRVLGEGVPHPRGYGNNARVLGRYVRDLKVLRLEDAVRKMTSLPANTFRLEQRGELRPGNWADLVVFDPAKVRDTATFDDPHHYPEGIRFVFVNGVLVVKDGEHTRARPGHVLRHSGG